jgi:transcription antitermination protein NusB
MKSRRKAREAVLQVLYQCDTLDDWSAEVVDTYFKVFHGGDYSAESVASHENYKYARRLISGVAEKLAWLDQRLSAASTRWSLSRMARVDRNILRMAAYEMEFVEEVPISVSINEAIEIAKHFGADDSSTFVNGVLDSIAVTLGHVRDLPPDDEDEPELKAAG